MPRPQHRLLRARFRLSRIGRLWGRRSRPSEPLEWLARDETVAPDAPATLVESEPGTGIARRGNRVAEMVAAHDAGRGIDRRARPRSSPAFAEAVFVELMRAHQYRRAFELLSSECRRAWGTPEAFAAAQARGSMGRLRGVRVKAVRHLPEWTDPDRDLTHHDVAELDVEYTIGTVQPAVVNRVVHLVADSGKWRSLCYPPGTDRSQSG